MSRNSVATWWISICQKSDRLVSQNWVGSRVDRRGLDWNEDARTTSEDKKEAEGKGRQGNPGGGEGKREKGDGKWDGKGVGGSKGSREAARTPEGVRS